MSDWHSLLYCKPLFGFDKDIKQWKETYIKIDWESGHFKNPEENIKEIANKYPRIIFYGLIHEYSNGSDTFWNVIFSKNNGLIYEGEHYEQDFSCSPYAVIIKGLRISNVKEINRKNYRK